MIAGLVHKYLWDAMLKEPTATQTIVDKFKLAKTTIHQQIWGKKYPGGGQKLQDFRGHEASDDSKGLGFRNKEGGGCHTEEESENGGVACTDC